MASFGTLTGPSSQAAARTVQADATIVMAGSLSAEPPQEAAAARPTSGSLGIPDKNTASPALAPESERSLPPLAIQASDLFESVVAFVDGVPKAAFYVTGRIGERAFSVHSAGERMILKREGEAHGPGAGELLRRARRRLLDPAGNLAGAALLSGPLRGNPESFGPLWPPPRPTP